MRSILSAARRHSAREVQAAIDAGQDVQTMNLHWTTALHEVARINTSGAGKCLRILVDAGAKVDAKDFDGWTPLHLAAMKACRKNIELLLAAGANARALNDDGKKPATICFNEECKAILRAAEKGEFSPPFGHLGGGQS